jgi:hypothetical protein
MAGGCRRCINLIARARSPPSARYRDKPPAEPLWRGQSLYRIEFDFAASNTNTFLNNNQGSVNGYIPRFRQGYAAFGGLLMSQTQGTLG